MAGLGLRAVDQLRALLSQGSRNFRCLLSAYSADPQQKNTGDQTPKGDSTEEKTFSVSSLETKALKLEEKVQDLTLRYEKAVTDSEAVRKRTQKFVQDAKLFGIQSFCRDLVALADILEHAVNEAEKQEKKDLSEILSSVEWKLQSIFTKNGLHKMTPVGGDYDPYDHEIVCHVPAEGRRPGSVATVQQVGYKLHGRTIRHAHVGIAVETQES